MRLRRFTAWLTLVLFTALVLGNAIGLGEGGGSAGPLYEAQANVGFFIRKSPKEDSKKLKKVEKGEKVAVYRVDEEWSLVEKGQHQGYCKTKWLWLFKAVDVTAPPVPGYPAQSGYAKVRDSVFAAVEGYSGNTFSPGDLLTVAAVEGDTAHINMMRDIADIPAEELEYTSFVPWREAEPGDVIAGYTTYYNEKTGGTKLSASRQYNIEHGCELLQGTVISPGKQFSFNNVCGPYVTKNGYVLGPNISSDGVGYGGGVCQLTTTLYNAVLGLPLQIDEWRIHRTSGVAYAPQFFDAVVGIYSDFTFTNTMDYPIHISSYSQNGVLTVLISRA